ncbi:MAG: hypothetical protein J1E42_09185 [Akkermansiaceae bacterium]|nr:hypothetical protein [Akkermansiaceae bacterium]
MKYTAIIASKEEFITSYGYRYFGKHAYQSDNLDDLLAQVNRYSSGFNSGFVWLDGDLYVVLGREVDEASNTLKDEIIGYPVTLREEEEDAEDLRAAYASLVARGIEPAIEML